MNPKKATKYYKQVAEDLNTEESLVEDFIEFYYKTIRFSLSYLTYPRINVEGLGHFVVKPKTVRNNIDKISKLLDDHDTSTYNAYFHKKMIETKLELLVKVEKKIVEQEKIKNNYKKESDESSPESNMGE